MYVYVVAWDYWGDIILTEALLFWMSRLVGLLQGFCEHVWGIVALSPGP